MRHTTQKLSGFFFVVRPNHGKVPLAQRKLVESSTRDNKMDMVEPGNARARLRERGFCVDQWLSSRITIVLRLNGVLKRVDKLQIRMTPQTRRPSNTKLRDKNETTRTLLFLRRAGFESQDHTRYFDAKLYTIFHHHLHRHRWLWTQSHRAGPGRVTHQGSYISSKCRS